jgi:hypothetical protein
MMGRKKGDPKGEVGGEARGGNLWNPQGHVENAKSHDKQARSATSEIHKRVIACGKRKGLPCTITPEEVRKQL